MELLFRFVRWLFVACFLSVVLAGQSAVASRSADAAWAEFEAARDAERPTEFTTRREKFAANEARQLKLRELGRAFFRDFPTDPRRWSALAAMLRERPNFILTYGPAIEQRADFTFDKAAQQAWRAELDALRTAMLASSDAPAALRARTEIDWLEEVIDDARWNAELTTADIDALHARVEECFRKFPSHPAVVNVAQIFQMLLREKKPAAVPAFEQALLQHENVAVREFATGRKNLQSLRERPMELAFAAADGRPFDLAALRGKVVLIDFWATWCGPCIAELPNVKRVYEKYHDHGFEVVGIALESADLRPGDSPEQREEKLTRAKKVLLDFVARENLPWPQHFDGKFWKNEISSRYAINSIPAMFLIGPDGKVATANARGEKLEAEVKRLLGL